MTKFVLTLRVCASNIHDMMCYIDSHCHLLNARSRELAHAHGVASMIINAADATDWGPVSDAARNAHDVYGAVGIHPARLKDIPADWAHGLREILRQNPHLMVGEIGLDKNAPDMPRQTDVFRQQLQIASELRRIVHVHCVGTWGAMSDILSASASVPAVVFHAYSGSPDLMARLATFGGYFSFGPAILKPQYKTMRAAVVAAPIERMLIETDCDDDNFNPDLYADIVGQIAAQRNKPALQMARQIYQNTKGMLSNG